MSKDKKQQYSIYIKEKLYDKLKQEAEKNYRSVNNELELLIKKSYNVKD